MSKVDDAWRCFSDLLYNHPYWPTTFSKCGCGRAPMRGMKRCKLCAKEELAELVGTTLAERAEQDMQTLLGTWDAIAKEAERKRYANTKN